jgi:hypothetical protein
MVSMLVYLWSREFPNAQINIYGLVNMKVNFASLCVKDCICYTQGTQNILWDFCKSPDSLGNGQIFISLNVGNITGDLACLPWVGKK